MTKEAVDKEHMILLPVLRIFQRENTKNHPIEVPDAMHTHQRSAVNKAVYVEAIGCQDQTIYTHTDVESY